ncbi:MAG TPA: flagellar motor protein MotB [Anaerolineales bacterium]|nr:flagellar motor protein MotB [Anaerolineales bacterium]HMX76195.1 flagellar motor protein MotB [Anaerolineales bacterium]HMZ05972.1 flagellar motor protein MotB [Anaerolineales bacterium]HNA88915.1 flagellar motor protein MotB [Anaerolineales bacterium]HNC88366.1 flagellar motor protein MotB [Anaerolineales bacterium]
MAHRKEDHEEHHDERWLVSYADFITLLMVLFVVLYSMGQVNVEKYKQLAESMRTAFTLGGASQVVDSQINQAGGTSEDGSSKPIVVPGIPEGPTQSEEVAGQLTSMLSSQNLGNQVSVQTNIEGVLISLSERLIFKNDQTELPAESLQVLDTIVEMLRPIDNKVRLVGHTNNTPPTNPAYPGNWELSLARATSVAKYLINSGISPERLIISGQGEYAPIFPNDTEQHKELNARVEIIIIYKVDSNIIDITSPVIIP